ncbi:hypothetical protein ACFSKN_08970 [Mariniflexile gromovii]|uniref:Lipoprotein n=1 Tax=Mariniflexile gromovii TaxID=362523 RepID=A0ABS4BU19_9FLAO|nr:hypothetical protein [Mariniflexile gromovii]MBP0904082.1 hypothetical protein [Mariniflexile gromovii]
MSRQIKTLIPFTFLMLIIGCADKNTEENRTKFDKILGAENVETVDYLVSDFENDFLKRQYPNLDTENAYRQFLTEHRDDNTEKWNSISQKARNKFKASKLRLEMYEFPDSVWILKNSTFDKIESDSLPFVDIPFPYIKSRYKYTNPNGTTDYTYSRSYRENISETHYDSIINQEMNSPRFNYIGKYLQALESIKNKSNFHQEFYDKKRSLGVLYPMLADVMLLENIDLNDKLNRRLIVLELIY